jgi:uncharacterized cupredoxin-like copper-binding protein
MKKRFSAALLTMLLISPSVFAGVASPISDSMQHHNEMNGQHASIGVPGKTSEVTKALNLTANDQMRFSLDTLDLQKGDTVSFTVTNTGQIHHEFVLGTREKIEMHSKEMQGMPNMKHADSNALSLKSGETKTLIWKFTSVGNFLAACTLPGHYEAGMITKIAVGNSN